MFCSVVSPQDWKLSGGLLLGSNAVLQDESHIVNHAFIDVCFFPVNSLRFMNREKTAFRE